MQTIIYCLLLDFLYTELRSFKFIQVWRSETRFPTLLFLHVSFTKSPQFLSPFSGPTQHQAHYRVVSPINGPHSFLKESWPLIPFLRWSKSRGSTPSDHQIIKSFSSDVKCSRLHAPLARANFFVKNTLCLYVCIWCVRSPSSSFMCMCGFARSHVLPQPMAHVSKQCPLSLPTFSSFHARYIFSMLFMLSTEFYKLIKTRKVNK